jgi:hypothetical protein
VLTNMRSGSCGHKLVATNLAMLVATNMAIWRQLVATNMWAFWVRVDIVDNVDNVLAIDSPSLNVRTNETTFHHMKYGKRSIVFLIFMGT